jgi:hypothetical protein
MCFRPQECDGGKVDYHSFSDNERERKREREREKRENRLLW